MLGSTCICWTAILRPRTHLFVAEAFQEMRNPVVLSASMWVSHQSGSAGRTLKTKKEQRTAVPELICAMMIRPELGKLHPKSSTARSIVRKASALAQAVSAHIHDQEGLKGCSARTVLSHEDPP